MATTVMPALDVPSGSWRMSSSADLKNNDGKTVPFFLSLCAFFIP
jgi:hypothetical protein